MAPDVDPKRPATKRDLVESLLDRGMVMVTLDARSPGVDVPPRLRDDGRLRLNLSHRFGLSMDLNDWGVHATLTFGGVPHPCKLPWGSIYQVLSHATSEQYVFPADVPDDLFPEGEEGSAAGAASGPGAGSVAAGGAKGKARLALVPGALAGEAGNETPAPAPAGPSGPKDGGGGGGRGHLRRIK